MTLVINPRRSPVRRDQVAAVAEGLATTMAVALSLRAGELWAAGCVQAALPGITVGQHDDNSAPNMYDLDLSISCGRTFGAMEITSAADDELTEYWSLLARRRGRWAVAGIAGGWSVHVRPDSRYKRLLKELPALLSALEQDGITTLFATPHARPAARDLAAAADQLGVITAWQGGTDFPGSIYVIPEVPLNRSGGVVPSTGDALSRWISEWITDLSRKDNLDKLRNSGARERHLFVIAPGLESEAPFEAVNLLMRSDTPMPAAAPELPPEVTHLWVTGGWAAGHGFRWSAEDGWQTFENDVVVDSSTLAECTCGLTAT